MKAMQQPIARYSPLSLKTSPVLKKIFLNRSMTYSIHMHY